MNIDIVSLKVVKERELECELPVFCINSPSHAAKVLGKFIGDSDRENFSIIVLDTKHQINAIHNVSIGTLNSTLVHAREVFKLAILHNAAAIIIGHNHPSGDTTPSMADLEQTKKLVEAGEILGIEIIDHLIVTGSDNNSNFISFKEKGLM